MEGAAGEARAEHEGDGFQQVCVCVCDVLRRGGGRIQGCHSALFIGWSYPEAKRCHRCGPYHAGACVQTWGGETEWGV